MKASLDYKAFFDAIRNPLFGGGLSEQQVQGVETITEAWYRYDTGQDVKASRAQLAYVLATAYHETAHTMKPVREIGRGHGKRYGKPGRNGGQVPYGRGYVQLTWDENYERADQELGLDGKLIANYDLALDPEIAVKILFRGMFEGWFTGKKLHDYVNHQNRDFRNARRVVNGLDKATHIAGYAKEFLVALTEGGWVGKYAGALHSDDLEPMPLRTPELRLEEATESLPKVEATKKDRASLWRTGELLDHQRDTVVDAIKPRFVPRAVVEWILKNLLDLLYRS